MWLFLLSTLVVLVNSSCSCSCSSTSTSAILFQTDSFEPHLSEQSGNHLKERKLLHDIGFLVELVISCCSRDLSATREGPAVIPNRWTVWNRNSWKFFASDSSVLCRGGFQPRTGVFFLQIKYYLRGSISSWEKRSHEEFHDLFRMMFWAETNPSSPTTKVVVILDSNFYLTSKQHSFKINHFLCQMCF